MMKINRKVNKLKIEIIIIITSILLMLLVLGFTGGVNIAAFEKNYTNSLVTNYAAIGGETVQKIEYAVRYGKPINNFFGMKELLLQSKQDFKDVSDIKILLRDKTIAYELDSNLYEDKLSDRLFETVDFNTAKIEKSHTYGFEGGKYHVFLPIRDAEAAWIATFDIIFDQQNIKQSTNNYIWILFRYLIILAVFGVIALFVMNKVFGLINDDGMISSKRLLFCLLIIMGSLQLIYGFINYNVFNNAYMQIAEENAKSTSAIITRDIESVIAKGVHYSELYKLDEYLKKITEVSKDIDEISLVDSNGKSIYSSKDEGGQQSFSPNERGVYGAKLITDKENSTASLYVRISKANINAKMKSIIFDTITVLVTSFFFMLELTMMVAALIKKRLDPTLSSSAQPAEAGTDMSLLRGLSFLTFTCIFIPTAIIPVMMKGLSQAVLGLPDSIVSGLPITMSFFSSAMGMLASGVLIDKKGWKTTFLAGSILIALGSLLSAYSLNSGIFILARTIAGFGDGFAIMALRGFVVSNESMQTEGFAGLNIGLNSGILCGVFIGAMLAERISFSAIFLISVAMAVISIIFAASVMKDSNPSVVTTVKEKSKIGLLTFLMDKRVFGLFAFIMIPTAICGTFLNFFLPVYFEANAISAANISRAYLLNGICIITLTSFLCEHVYKRFGHRVSTALASLIIICAICIFALHGSVATALLVAAALGIAESFGIVAYDSYLLSLDVTEEIGEGKALSYLNNIKRIGQMLGPIVFGSLAALGTPGIGIIGLIFLAATLLFLLTSATKRDVGKGMSA